jgi:L-alanine-DL-glutamate epimerase-like enolase superfamily enzyme
MKITRVDIASVRIPPTKTLVVATYGSMKPEFVLTKVYTDDGIVGFVESPPLPPPVAEVPEGPGLGVELDDAKIKKYSSEPTITCT